MDSNNEKIEYKIDNTIMTLVVYKDGTRNILQGAVDPETYDYKNEEKLYRIVGKPPEYNPFTQIASWTKDDLILNENDKTATVVYSISEVTEEVKEQRLIQHNTSVFNKQIRETYENIRNFVFEFKGNTYCLACDIRDILLYYSFPLMEDIYDLPIPVYEIVVEESKDVVETESEPKVKKIPQILDADQKLISVLRSAYKFKFRKGFYFNYSDTTRRFCKNYQQLIDIIKKQQNI